jgi:hypothetical protein
MDRIFETTSTAAHQTGDHHETHDQIEIETQVQNAGEEEDRQHGRERQGAQGHEEAGGEKETRCEENDEGRHSPVAQSQREKETGAAQSCEALGQPPYRDIKRGPPDEAGRVLIPGF